VKACVSHKDLIWRQVPEPIRESRGVNPPKKVLTEQRRRGENRRVYVAAMNGRALLAAAALIVGLALAGCGSGSSSHTASPTSSATTTPSPTTAPVAAGAPTCPTLTQADAALGVSHNGPIRIGLRGGGILCEYTGAGGIAAVAIYAHQTAAVFAGQVANAPGAPAMARISGVGDGAFGQNVGGVSIVNAYADASRTIVAAQAHGAALASAEALARVALADN